MGYVYSYGNKGNYGMIGNSRVGKYVNKNKNTKGILNEKMIEMISSKDSNGY